MRRIGLPLVAVLAALTVAAPASAAITFSSKSINTGATPQGIVADFFHGGGNADLLTANSGDSNTDPSGSPSTTRTTSVSVKKASTRKKSRRKTKN